jgi:hypothetical protein
VVSKMPPIAPCLPSISPLLLSPSPLSPCSPLSMLPLQLNSPLSGLMHLPPCYRQPQHLSYVCTHSPLMIVGRAVCGRVQAPGRAAAMRSPGTDQAWQLVSRVLEAVPQLEHFSTSPRLPLGHLQLVGIVSAMPSDVWSPCSPQAVLTGTTGGNAIGGIRIVFPRIARNRRLRVR